MTLLAVPFQPMAVNERTAQALLDGVLSVPAIFPTPGTPEVRRLHIASVLSNPQNHIWLVWNGGALTGVLAITDIIPGSDAQAHFVFFDRVLFGRKTLLWNLMGRVFRELNLQRLSIEVPEYLTPLYKFARKKLMFKLEGEGIAEQHPLVTQKLNPYVPNGPTWAARLGSRRERACWNPETETWTDMLRLRLLRSEYEHYAGEESIDATRRSESRVQPGPAQSARPQGHPGRAPATDRLPPHPQLVPPDLGGPR